MSAEKVYITITGDITINDEHTESEANGGRFLIDTHVHTAETSACCKIGGAMIAEIYARSEYRAIVVCDHYSSAFFAECASLPWAEQVERYLAGYRCVRSAGEPMGLNVFLGIELQLLGCDNHYVVLGIDEQFLLEHQKLFSLSLFEAYELFTAANALLIQAHPFRAGATPVNPELIHGIEVVNGHPGHVANNHRSIEYAKKYGLLMTGGSDTHFTEGACTAGMVFPDELNDVKDLACAIRERKAVEIIGPEADLPDLHPCF